MDWSQAISDRDIALATLGPDGSVFVAMTTALSTDGDSLIVVKLHPDDGHTVWTFQLRGPLRPTAVALLADGSLAVAGYFLATLDFDPSLGRDIHSPGATGRGAFVTRLTRDGGYGWTRTLADQPDGNLAVAGTPDGGLALGSVFSQSIDLDPTDGVDLRVSANGRGAPYLVRLSAAGSYLWGRTFDGSDPSPTFQGLTVDGTGNPAMAVSLIGSMDVDPGPGVQMIPSNGPAPWHVVVALDGDGRYRWSHVLSIAADLTSRALQIVFASDGDLVAAGNFSGSADFDPMGAHHIFQAPTGASEVFLTRLATGTGAERFTGVVATLGSSELSVVAPVPKGGVCAGIAHDQPIDVDPGPGMIIRANDGTGTSALILALSSNGAYVSDAPISVVDGQLLAAGDAQAVAVSRSESTLTVIKYAPARP